MAEARRDTLRLDFDRKLKLEFHATKVTSNACNFGSDLITYGREETC